MTLSQPDIAALLAIGILIIYVVFGGADFGGGVLDLLARGPRKQQQRAAIAHAIGPVWESNHVWLIFMIVILFSCFPGAYATILTGLFWCLNLALVGITLRGTAFVFRHYATVELGMPTRWGTVFGAASLFTPFVMGMAFGAVTSGSVVDSAGQPNVWGWLTPFSFACGLFALAICAYLAAVFMTNETDGEVREDFRRSALLIWVLAGVASVGVLLLAREATPHVIARLFEGAGLPLLLAGFALAPLSLALLWFRRFTWARVTAIAQVAAILLGWAVAQWPYLIYPTVTIQQAAAPPATLSWVLWTLPFGLGLLVPSLLLLFWIFKRPATAAPGAAGG